MKKWMENLKISKKMTMTFLFSTILSIIIGAVGVSGMAVLTNNQQNTYRQCTSGILVSSQMLTEMDNITIYLNEMYLNYDNENLNKKQYLIQIDSAFKSIDQSISQFPKTYIDDTDRQNLETAKAPYSEYKAAVNSIVSAVNEGKSADEVKKMLKESKNATSAVKTAFKAIVSNKTISASKRIASDTKAADILTYVLVGITVISIVLALLLGKLITGTMAPQIRKFAAFMRNFAVGDLDVLKVFDLDDKNWALRKDEIGTLTDSNNKVIVNTFSMVAQLQAIADGDLTTEVNVRSEFDVQGKALRELVRKFHELTLSIIEASDRVTAGAAMVADSGASLSQGASMQASSIQQLSATAQEIASKTAANAKNARTANDLALDVSRNAETGNSQMKEMLGAMDEINISSGNIGRIIKVIDDIAFQTNILALNAAVEAARAGQHGKGFAVVAKEVRNLAAKSAGAARDTTSLIEGSLRTVEKGTVIAQRTAEALEGIVKKVEDAADLIGTIALASEDQTEAIEQINQEIAQISQIVQDSASLAEESAATSEELSNQAAILQEQTAFFKVSRNKTSGDCNEPSEKFQYDRQEFTALVSKNQMGDAL
jgi:methyl-accepting chemotaxis protein